MFSLLCFFQTDGSVPNTLVVGNVEVVKPRVAAAEHISQVILIFIYFYLINLVASACGGVSLLRYHVVHTCLLSC